MAAYEWSRVLGHDLECGMRAQYDGPQDHRPRTTDYGQMRSAESVRLLGGKLGNGKEARMLASSERQES